MEDAAPVGNALSAVESRAVLVARLVALLRGRQDEKRKSVDFPYLRREVPEFIAQVLNKGEFPRALHDSWKPSPHTKMCRPRVSTLVQAWRPSFTPAVREASWQLWSRVVPGSSMALPDL